MSSYLHDIDRTKVPAHVAIVMDGNGRWAKARGLARRVAPRANALRAARGSYPGPREPEAVELDVSNRDELIALLARP